VAAIDDEGALVAGEGYKVWTRERLTVADVQGLLMDQSVLNFPSASAADAELVEPTAGMVRYLLDTDRYEGRTPASNGDLEGGTWRGFGRHWGTIAGALPAPSITDPSKPSPGDTCYPSGWACLAVVHGATWQQAAPLVANTVASLASRATTATAAGQPLPVGFLVYVEATDRYYSLDSGAVWRLVGGRAGTEVNAFGSATAGTGWALVTNNPILQHHGNGMATVALDVTRTGADIAPSTTGKVTNVPLCTLPTGWEARGASPMGPGAAGNRSAFGIITALSRVVTLTGVTGTANIATGATISLVGTYPLAAPQDLTS
jgi:hypothetical protein